MPRTGDRRIRPRAVIVVTGARGQLGTAFRRLLGDDARYLTRDDLDLSDRDAIQPVLERLRPSLLINCAANTAVDRAESDPELAEAVNGAAVGIMAETMDELGGRFVTFSTDYVFDGTSQRPYVESNTPNPINTHGMSKRNGEVAALAACSETLIIRTSWLLSGTHHNFATTMIRLAREGDVIVVDDQRGHPTLVNDLVRTTLSVLDTGAGGVLHVTNTGVASWYELARDIVDYAGLDTDRIRPCSTAEYPTAAMRPTNSVIESERMRDLGIQPMPDYHIGLRDAVEQVLTWMG